MKQVKRRAVALGGSAVSAVLASSCCIAPLATLAFGLGGLAGLAFLAKWRPVFLGFTFALLALAWYQSYRKPTNALCENEGCARKPIVQWTRIILLLATAFVLVTAAFPIWSGAVVRHVQSGTQTFFDTPGSQRATLRVRIPSMDCNACAVLIQNKLRRQAGILNATVTFQTKRAVVHYDTVEISAEKITTLIGETGFKAEPITP